MNNPAKFLKLKCPQRDQYKMKINCLDLQLPSDHIARDIWGFVEEMDTNRLLDSIKSFVGGQGRAATDPKILLAVWIYSILEGNGSARKLEELCKNHIVYQWIVGDAPINRTMLAAFKSHDSFKFEDLLASCLAVMHMHGVIRDEDFAQDGSRIKANAGFASFRTEGALRQLTEELRVYIQQLSEEANATQNNHERLQTERKKRRAIEKRERIQNAIDELQKAKETKIENAQKDRKKISQDDLDSVRASTTDPEVRKMKMGDGGFRLAYNVQFATGMESRVIYGVDVVNTLDPGTSPSMIGKVSALLNRLKMNAIKLWVGDSAYSGKNDVNMIAKLYPTVTYYAPPQVCKGVDAKKALKTDSEAVKNWRSLIDDEKIKAKYSLRCSTAEFSNAQVKNHGLRQFLMRGIEKTKGEAILHAIVHNIQRFFSLTRM